jgi:hypothetical protein
MEKRIVHDVALSAFPANNPIAFANVTKTCIRGHGLGFRALFRIDDQGPKSSKCAHVSSVGHGNPQLV